MRVNWASLAARVLPRAHAQHEAELAGAALVLDLAGALYWPEHGLLVVSDLHLEKGSSFAARGSLLPPYDTHDTLRRLGETIVRYAPRVVIALGDNFHDNDGPARLAAEDRQTLAGLQRGREWVWIAGNHDPEPAAGIGGMFAEEVVIGPLWFRHQSMRGVDASNGSSFLPSPLVGKGRVGGRFSSPSRDQMLPISVKFDSKVGQARLRPEEGGAERSEARGEGVSSEEYPSPGFATSSLSHPLPQGKREPQQAANFAKETEPSSGEISGHLHPVAVVAVRGVGVRRRCFASDGARMVMPAFGAYAGGLNIRHAAFRSVFSGAPVIAHVIGDQRLFAIPAETCA